MIYLKKNEYEGHSLNRNILLHFSQQHMVRLFLILNIYHPLAPKLFKADVQFQRLNRFLEQIYQKYSTIMKYNSTHLKFKLLPKIEINPNGKAHLNIRFI